MKTTTHNKSLTYFYRTTAAAALLWTATIICSAAWNVYHERLQTLALVKKEALSSFNKDQAFRRWGAKHGGVYVPPTKQTPPNPYLSNIPDRDITLPSGKRLTLMNPAYMVRQMMADFNELYGIKGRITSLKPLNPANAPDAWEREALTDFDEGTKEYFDITEHDGQQSLRLMRPMVTQTACLKCHARQGYREGDIRGGVEIIVPMAPYLSLQKKTINAMIFSHLGIWMLGAAMLGLVLYRGKQFILEQDKSRDALAESEERLKRFSDIATEGLLFHDQGIVIDANPSLLSLLGYATLGDVVGMSLFDVIVPEDHERVRRKIITDAVEPCAAWLRRRDGTVFPAELIARTYALKGRRLSVVSVRDITERKRAEQALNLSREHYKSLYDNNPLMLFTLDTDGKVLSVNKAGIENLGYAGEELVGKPIINVFHEDDREAVTRQFKEYLREPSAIARWEFRKKRKDGSVLWVYETVQRLRHADDASSILIVCEDVTQRRRAEEQLRDHHEHLEDQVKARTAELEKKNAELEHLNRLFVGRELRMAELKEKIAKLEQG